jgi:RNA polymerase sigma factor (sigma-70 family)
VNTLSDEELVLGIKEKDREVFAYIYRCFYYEARGWLMKSLSNREADVKDVFQDAIISIYLIVIKNDFSLKSSFKTFLISVINNVLLLKIRHIERDNVIKGSSDTVEKFIEKKLGSTEEVLLEDRMITEMRINLIRRKFMELPDDCKKILKRFFDEVALKNIAKTLGYKSENYVKKRKYLCKEYLKKKIEEDIYYKIIREHENI